MRNREFYFLSISFLVGVFIFSYTRTPVEVLICIAGLSFLFFCFFSAHNSFRRGFVPIIMGSILCLCLGAIRIEATKSGNHPLDQFVGKKVTLLGVICDEPSKKESSQGLCFKPAEIPNDDLSVGSDKILLNVSLSEHYKYGDVVTLAGKLELPSNFTAYDGGPEFDYVSYLGKDDVRYVMRRPKITRSAKNEGNQIVKALISIKTVFMDRTAEVIPEPQVSLVGGLLLGEKNSLPKQVSEDFKRSGLTHILVLSGSNVTVVAESLLYAFSFLPRFLGRSLGAFSVVLFAIMTGASATTVRATLMALIGLFAQAIGRRYDVVRALTIAAVCMVIQNPLILAFDISFQLSFLATIAVIFVSPLVKERLSFVPEIFGMREVVSMTTATQLFTFPFIFSKMGEISIIALLPNLLILPIVSYSMLGGFVTGMVQFVAHFIRIPIALPFAFVTNIMLVYMLKVTAFFSAFPFATIKATLGPLFLFISYVLFAGIIYFLRRKSAERQPS